MAKENTLWSWLRKARQVLRELDIERVENSVATGTPDTDGCYKCSAFKIELKRSPAPKRGEAVTITWQKRQQPWLRRRWRAGGLAWLLLAVGEGHNIQRFLIRGCDIDDLGESRAVGKKVVQSTTLSVLRQSSVIHPQASAADIILTASGHQFG